MVGGAIVEPTEEQIASYTKGSVVVKILDFFWPKNINQYQSSEITQACTCYMYST